MANGAVMRPPRGVVLTVAALLPLAVSAALSPFRETVSAANAVLLLVLVVVAAAASGDRIAGVVAAVSSGVWYDFFLVQPYDRFTIAQKQGVVETVLLVLIGLAVTEVALWGRRQQARASRRAGYLDGALRTAEVASARQESPDRVVDLVARQLVDVLGISRCRYVPGPVYDARFAVLDHAGLVTRGGHELDVERNGLPTDEETVLMMVHEGVVVGHFVLTSAAEVARPSVEQRRVAVLLADQAAAALGHPS